MFGERGGFMANLGIVRGFKEACQVVFDSSIG